MGPKDSDDVKALHRAIGQRYLPNKIVALVDPDNAAFTDESPMCTGKSLKEGQPAAYVCRNQACQAPVTTVEELAELLQ